MKVLEIATNKLVHMSTDQLLVTHREVMVLGENYQTEIIGQFFFDLGEYITNILLHRFGGDEESLFQAKQKMLDEMPRNK